MVENLNRNLVTSEGFELMLRMLMKMEILRSQRTMTLLAKFYSESKQEKVKTIERSCSVCAVNMMLIG